MLESQLFGLLFRNLFTAGIVSLCMVIILGIVIEGKDLSGQGVDIVIVFRSILVKFYIILPDSVIRFQMCVHEVHFFAL